MPLFTQCWCYKLLLVPCLEPGLCPEVLEGYFTGWTEIFLAWALNVSKPDLLQLIDVIAPEIFPKLYCIPLLMTCQLINNNWHNLCFHSPYFRDFDIKVFVFQDLFSDLCRGVLFGWYWLIDKLATSVGVVLDHYLYQACSLTTLHPYIWQLSTEVEMASTTSHPD